MLVAFRFLWLNKEVSDLSDFHEFECPYCMASNSVDLDPSGGRAQSFVTDCETCCQPIAVTIEFDGDEMTNFEAKPENE
jgi:hypothetical protein